MKGWCDAEVVMGQKVSPAELVANDAAIFTLRIGFGVGETLSTG